MDEKDKKAMMNHAQVCGAWCGCGHRHLVLRWILGIVILATVFCLGVKLGEVKTELEYTLGMYGYGMMGARWHGAMGGYGMPYAASGAAAAPMVHVVTTTTTPAH